jgi:hypothetical protein
MNFCSPLCLCAIPTVSLLLAKPEVAAGGEWLLVDLGFFLDLGRTLRLALDPLRTRRSRACRFARRAALFHLAVRARVAGNAGVFPLSVRTWVALHAYAFPLAVGARDALRAGPFHLAVGAGAAHFAVGFHLAVRAGVALDAHVFPLPVGAAFACVTHEAQSVVAARPSARALYACSSTAHHVLISRLAESLL